MSSKRSARRMRKMSPSLAQSQGGRVVPLELPHLVPTDPSTANGRGWFGPGEPMAPTAPPEVAGRRTDFNAGWNQNSRPRAYEPVGFAELRGLADGYDLLRLAIETRKDQVARLKFNIVPRDEALRKKMTPEMKAHAKTIEDLLRRPDRDKFWSSWIRDLLEDLLVIDAPTVHIRRTIGGDIWSLDQIDGATIKRVIDDHGRTPEPPFAAYQQVLKGLPAVNYTKNDLLYRPRNGRVHKFYGFSPVEQVMMTINIALRRQMWQLAYFTDGNIPDSLIGVPSTWTPDQIRQFQNWFDGILTGDTRRRRGGVFVPGEVAKSYVPTKEAEIFGAAEEWMARVICYCFGLSHTALVKQVNRAVAETAREEAIEDGMAPIMNWIKELMDSLLIDQLGELDMEFMWVDDKELDPKVQSEILTSYTPKMMTINEARAQLGEDPVEDPEADMLGSYGTDGTFVPLNTEKAIELKKKNLEAFPAPVMGEIDPETGEPRPPAPGSADSEGAATSGGEEAGGADDSAKPASAEGKKGKAKPPFGKLSGRLGKAAQAPAELLPSTLDRPLARRARKALQRVLETALRETGDAVAAHVEKVLVGAGVRKADDALTDDEIDRLIKEVMAGLSLSDLEASMDDVSAELERVARDAGRIALAQIGVEKRAELVDQVNERAVAWAQARSAELVGKRVLSSGTIIDNPNPKWAITDSTRKSIQDFISGALRDNLGSDAIVAGLQDSYSFSPERADMVSRTEIAMANSESAMQAYHVAQDAGVSLRKEWILGEDPCEICQANADQGPIGLEEEFDSGDDTSPAHPHCECAVVPVVDDEEVAAASSEQEE